MSPVSLLPPRRPTFNRGRLLVASAVILVLGYIGAGPLILDAWRFRASSLVGLSPAEVISKLGEPVFARPLSDGSPDWKLPEEFERPVWRDFDGPTRERVLASPRFMLNYAGPMGSRHTVTFEHGAATAVDSFAK